MVAQHVQDHCGESPNHENLRQAYKLGLDPSFERSPPALTYHTKLSVDPGALVDDLPDGPAKARYNRRAMLVHALLDGLKGDAVDDGLVQPMSGGGPKP